MAWKDIPKQVNGFKPAVSSCQQGKLLKQYIRATATPLPDAEKQWLPK